MKNGMAMRAIVCATALTLVGANAFAMSKDQAKRIYDRVRAAILTPRRSSNGMRASGHSWLSCAMHRRTSSGEVLLTHATGNLAR